MKIVKIILLFYFWLKLITACAAQTVVTPQVRSRISDSKVTVVDVAAHFVSAIRLPEAVNSIAVGDAALFQVEHSEREPDLVLVKALTERNAETNLIISTVHGRQFSLLLVNRGDIGTTPVVDFVLQYKPARSFLVEPDVVPFPLIGQTAPIINPESMPSYKALVGQNEPAFMPPALLAPTSTSFQPKTFKEQPRMASLDNLLERQRNAPLPKLYGERIEGENVKGDRLRVGISEVLDGGDQVSVLFSVVNTSRHAILLMPPQIQLGGKSRMGRLVKHERWATAEQLLVADFRLSGRRLGTGERADGVVVFERPPYKQSSEQLFLQMAESGAVDRPALAPIGFGVSSVRQEAVHAARATAN